MRALLGLVAAACLLWPGSALAAAFGGSVVRVSDGDTVVVRAPGGDTKIRLLGIDAPEKDQEPWGPRARTFLAQLVAGKAVRVETDVQPRDRYGRTLGYLYVGKVFVNLELVRQGYAMLYTFPPNVAHTAELVAAQREARDAGRKIWGPEDGLTTSPYEWRHHKPPPRALGQEGLRASGESVATADVGLIVGNRHSRKFHSATCALGARVSARNRVSFATAEEALAAGMTPCGVCKGR